MNTNDMIEEFSDPDFINAAPGFTEFNSPQKEANGYLAAGQGLLGLPQPRMQSESAGSLHPKHAFIRQKACF